MDFNSKNTLSQSELLASEQDQHGLAEEFARSVVHHGLEQPVNSLGQFAGMPELHLIDYKEAEEGSAWFAQQAGTAVGMLPWIVGLHALGKGSFAKVAGAESLAAIEGKLGKTGMMTLEAGLTGGAYEGLLRPVSDQDGNFWAARGTNALTGAASFSAMMAAGLGVRSFARGNAESFTIAGSERLGNAFSGLVGGGAGGLAGVEVKSLLTKHDFASAGDAWKATATGASLGGAFGLVMPVERVERIEKQSHGQELLTPRQLLERGELSAQKTEQSGIDQKFNSASVKIGDTKMDVVVHELELENPNQFIREKYFKADAVQTLNEATNFSNSVAATARRSLMTEAGPKDVWLEQRFGHNIQDSLTAAAEQRFGAGTPENVVRLIEQEPALKLSLEQTLAQRIALGDTDINPGNILRDGQSNTVNVDWVLAFSPMKTPSWGQSSGLFEVMSAIRGMFAGKPLSAQTALSLERLAQAAENSQVKSTLLDKGLQEIQVDAVAVRSRAMVKDGFPQAKEIFDYFEENNLVDEFYRANPMKPKL